MTPKKFLSTKKTSRQTISISPALKEWISRYVKHMRKKHPKDERYDSISAFYTYVMEKAMNAFEKGKTLDDFDRFLDGKIYDFYDKYSYKAHRPLYEMCLKTNRYTDLDYKGISQFLIKFEKNFKQYFDLNNLDKLKTYFNRLERYLSSNKLTDTLKFELLESNDSDSPENLKIRNVTVCPYDNISYENHKLFAAIFTVLGMKVTEFFYSRENNYYRMEAVPTEFFLKDEFLREEKLQLFQYNISFLTNYKEVLKDENDFYLWMKMARDKGVRVDFNDKFARERWLETIESDLKMFSSRENRDLNMLRFFEAIHWIDIENEGERIFKFRLSNSKKDEEKRDFLLDYLGKYSEIEKVGETFQLK